MIELYVLNKNLEKIGLIDTYSSLIWANRYWEVGDCELYLEMNTDILNLIKQGNYLARSDDDMICKIESIEVETDALEGNYLIVKGYDVKKLLHQRVIWGTMNADGKVEDYIRAMVNNSLGDPTLSARQIKKENGDRCFYLGNAAGFTEVLQEQESYANVGEKIEDLCKKYSWGYKVVLSNGNFYFLLYKGTDRSNTVVFSPNFENLHSTKYLEDVSKIANVALTGGEGEGSERSRNVSGYAEGVDRYEIFVDAKDLSKTIKWKELTGTYPTTDEGGQGYIATEGTSYVYKMNYLDVIVVDDNQLAELKAAYPESAGNHEITIDGNLYYRIYNVTIADLTSNNPEDSDDTVLRELIYSTYLLSRGYENLANYRATITFEGSVEPDITFVYNQDYFLGDLVSVDNEYGIGAEVRIVEITEVYDDKGYSIEPKFEYVEVN